MIRPHGERLAALRAELAAQGLDGVLVPLTDPHLSEYVEPAERRLEWLTGFTGSAGTAVVLGTQAAVFLDGRYTEQGRLELAPELFEQVAVPQDLPGRWLARTAPAGARIAIDPWLISRRGLNSLTREAPDVCFVPVHPHPVDRIWTDRPAFATAPAVPHPVAFAGEPHEAKLGRIAAELSQAGADAVVLSLLNSVAWAFNIRGADVPHTPVVRAFALVFADGTAHLFLDPAKASDALRRHLGPAVQLSAYTDFAEALGALGGRRVWVDPAHSVVAVAQALERAGAQVLARRDPVILMKACKNATEIAGMRAAHRRDGAALTRFLAWLAAEGPRATQDELSAAARLEAFRREAPEFRDLSFDTISAMGPNGALPHYRATAASNRPIAPPGLYLVNSGAQYPDGTTDVTRTVAIGAPTPAMRAQFTRVLKGHIALATARFPRGTRGGQLDALARQHLWAAGLDYAHGTGHGVGCFLSVHEGPQRIAAHPSAPGVDEPLLPGMVVSNEPGLYLPGEYGIRIENLVLVVEDPRPHDVEPMLAFETLTLAPIDLALVEPELMTEAERAWLDAYHARVRDELSPLVDPPTRAWLEAATRPLAAALRPAA